MATRGILHVQQTHNFHILHNFQIWMLYTKHKWGGGGEIRTPNAEYRLVRLWLAWFRNTSDFGLGGFFGLSMTRVSSHISSSSSFESDDTDSCRLTRSWSPRLELQSENKTRRHDNYFLKKNCVFTTKRHGVSTFRSLKNTTNHLLIKHHKRYCFEHNCIHYKRDDNYKRRKNIVFENHPTKL